MRKKNVKQVILPLLSALIWGSAFTAQSLSAGHVPAFTFNALRSVAAVAALLVVIFIMRTKGAPDTRSKAETQGTMKDLVRGGICCGVFLTLGSNLQQLGIERTSVGKAGFITALYVVLVPLLGLCFHKHVSAQVWVSVGIATLGLYFLCIKAGSGFSINTGDLFVLLCAFCFTGQILCVDHFVQKVGPVELSCAQFVVVTIISAVAALIRGETVVLSEVVACLPYILYVGIFSSGVAYTLQIIAQKDGDPTIVSLLLCLESFFAALCGALILHEKLSGREYLGCALMLVAVFLSQLPEKECKAVESGSKP